MSSISAIFTTGINLQTINSVGKEMALSRAYDFGNPGPGIGQ